MQTKPTEIACDWIINGLRIALEQLGQAPFVPGTSKIVQPADDATAARYLRYATPLLNWYRHKG